MFRFFKERQLRAQRKKAIEFHYPACLNAIKQFINDRPEPTKEEILQAAVNAKLFFELFRSVPGSRDFAHPIVTNGMMILVEIEGISYEDAAAKVTTIVKQEISSMLTGRPILAFPAIRSANIMSNLIGFN